jgi:hypothetical protein
MDSLKLCDGFCILSENNKSIKMKNFVKKYWEGALVAQIGLVYILYEYYTNDQISSVGISFFAIGNLIVLGKAFYKK